MFFKRNQGDKSAPDRDPPGDPMMASSRADAPTPLPAAELRRVVDPARLGFKTTAELEPVSGLIGQELVRS